MKILLFKPELGTLTRFEYTGSKGITRLLKDNSYNFYTVLIDGVPYRLYVGNNSHLIPNNILSLHHNSTNKCLYGNIVIEAMASTEITAEDILRIKAYIIKGNKGYMLKFD